MPNIPVLCHNCETLFGVNILEGAILDNTLLGDNPFPCPSCGKTGYTLTGLYSNVRKTLDIVLSSYNSSKSLTLLAQKLEELNSKKLEPDIFHQEIQDNIPELQRITDILPKTRIEIYNFIYILIAALTLLIATINYSANNNSVSQESIQNVTINAIDILLQNNNMLNNQVSKNKADKRPTKNNTTQLNQGDDTYMQHNNEKIKLQISKYSNDFENSVRNNYEELVKNGNTPGPETVQLAFITYMAKSLSTLPAESIKTLRENGILKI